MPRTDFLIHKGLVNRRVHVISTVRDCTLAEDVSLNWHTASRESLAHNRDTLAMHEQMQSVVGEPGVQLVQIGDQRSAVLVSLCFTQVENVKSKRFGWRQVIALPFHGGKLAVIAGPIQPFEYGSRFQSANPEPPH